MQKIYIVVFSECGKSFQEDDIRLVSFNKRAAIDYCIKINGQIENNFDVYDLTEYSALEIIEKYIDD